MLIVLIVLFLFGVVVREKGRRGPGGGVGWWLTLCPKITQLTQMLTTKIDYPSVAGKTYYYSKCLRKSPAPSAGTRLPALGP